MGSAFLGYPVFLPKQGKTKVRVQRKHNIGTSPAHAPKQHTAGQGAKHECAQGTLMSIIHAKPTTTKNKRTVVSNKSNSFAK